MKASVNDGRSQSQRLASFLLNYQNTPHSTTRVAPSELFLKRKLRTRLDLIHPDIHSTVHNGQAKQKKNHDHHCQGHEYFIRQNVSARNFCAGPPWTAGVVVERLGPLTYLVQVNLGLFWRKHIDHLCPMDDSVDVQGHTDANSPLMPDQPAPSDFVPIVESEDTETVSVPNEVVEPALPPATERRYPQRSIVYAKS